MKDYTAQWFEIYRQHLEPTDIIFSIERDNKTELVNFPHEKSDGVGALHLMAEKFNWQIQNQSAIKPKKIGMLKYFINCIAFLYWAHPRRNNIWPFTFKKADSVHTLQTLHKFTRDETTALLTKAKWLKVSLNTLLFYALNQTIVEKFDLQQKEISWWIPVNMRPDLGLDVNDPQINRNYVSNFPVDIFSDTSLTDCQQLISKALKQQKHWATWWWQNIGRFLPAMAIEIIAKRNLQDNYYAGAFSNLGNWTCKEQNSNISFFVNPLLSHPIGAGAIIWNGQLNITLRVYPTFPIAQGELDRLIAAWAKAI